MEETKFNQLEEVLRKEIQRIRQNYERSHGVRTEVKIKRLFFRSRVIREETENDTDSGYRSEEFEELDEDEEDIEVDMLRIHDDVIIQSDDVVGDFIDNDESVRQSLEEGNLELIYQFNQFKKVNELKNIKKYKKS